MKQLPIEKSLVLSTGHMPDPHTASKNLRTPELFVNMRHSEHEHGWIVFISKDPYWTEVPHWLKPIYTLAILEGCSIINFDQDAEVLDCLQTWDW
jgi:hypothetical protein